MRTVLVLIMIFALFLSCESDKKSASPQPIPQSVKKEKPSAADVKAAAPKQIEGIAIDDVFAIKSKQFEYTYNPIQKRDPFKPYEGEITYFEEGDKTPLERYDLSQLQLTAIIWGISEPRALVSAPDGQDYIVKKDMRMGRNLGRVSRITKKEVVVAEEYRDPLGKLVVKETPLLLHEKGDLEKLMLELQ